MAAARDMTRKEGTRDSALDAKKTAAYAVSAAAAAAAYAAADAAYAADVRDRALAQFAEDVVQILIELKAPGCQWLVLTEAVS